MPRPESTSALLGRLTFATLAALCASSLGAQSFEPQVPRTWDPEQMETFELPLASPEHSPRHVSAEYYESLPVREVYRSYPVYHPEREPEGYWEQLQLEEPKVVFDATRLESKEDWIEAGALVFDAPISYDGPIVSADEARDPDWFDRLEIPLTADGIAPGMTWVVREKGKVELANLACAMCHSRVMPDGSVVRGAQGLFPLDRIFADQARRAPPEIVDGVLRRVVDRMVATPWLQQKEAKRDSLTGDELIEQLGAIPPGVLLRQGTDIALPPKIPDLIGIRDRRYLDSTGLVRHRGPGDIMRYAAVNQTLDMLASYGGWIPDSMSDHLPELGQAGFVGTTDRYSDEQLYALTLFLYSLEPPENPNQMTELARRGQRVFEQQRCSRCHTPPLYTNNHLVPAPGFEPPAEHQQLYDVSEERVDTDPTLTMTTRRGTGYYRVPSLLGVWYRGPFEHNGSVATLEDWFDPARFDPAYRPTGWGPETPPRAVEGHPFGTTLSAEDKAALIAFLKTL